MPVRPVDLQSVVQQSGGTAAQHAGRMEAPLAAQAQAEIAEPDRTARRQSTVQRGHKGEAQRVGERPGERQRRQDRRRGGHDRRRHGGQTAAQSPTRGVSPDGKGRMLDVRL